jgi:hypothetical protein
MSRGATPCDAGLALDDADPLHGASAIELCDLSDGSSPGVVSAEFGPVDFASALDATGILGVGIPAVFGPNVSPRRGARMLALSSGTARTPSDAGYGGDDFSKGSSSTPPPGFPASVGACPVASAVHDSAALRLALVAPAWANSFDFDFRFYTADYPDYLCSSVDDQFVALVSPPPAGSLSGDVAFDAQVNPITVNSADWITVCAPGGAYACASGTSELAGTGFEGHGATPWLTNRVPVQPGQSFTVVLAIWDGGDALGNSTVLLDDFRWSGATVAGPTTQLAPEPDWTGAAACASLLALQISRARRRRAAGGPTASNPEEPSQEARSR